jgi:hypothetical protein
MKRYFRQHLVLALALAALVPTLSFAQNKLVVAIQPTVASDEMLNKAKPLQQFMEKELGGRTKVELVGYLAKIYADLFEGTDPEIIEAVQSTGASKLQLVRFVIVPEAANAILAQVLFMLEYNIRASSVLGFVGAGGLGFVIQIYLQSLDYQRLATILLLVLVIVLVMDGISAWLRRRYLLAAHTS